MKSIICSLTIICFFTATTENSSAQNYLSLFGDTSTTWDIVLHGYCDAVCPETVFVSGDTTISANTYKIISGLPGFVREDTVQGKAWFYDTYNNSEYLVMDLTLNLGDTFNIYNSSNVANPFLVDSIYYASNKKHVRLNAWTNMCSLEEPITFIEGSGTTASFSYQRELNGNSVASSMLCHHKNGIKVAGNILFGDSCSFDCSIGIAEFNSNKNIVNIFPNPTIDELTIETNNIFSNNPILTIYNAFGERIISQKLINVLTTINTSNLYNGVYFLVVSDNISKKHQRFIKE